MIKIINPKHTYIAGTQISMYHLRYALKGECEFYAFDKGSEMLEDLGVVQTILDPNNLDGFWDDLDTNDVVIFNDLSTEKGFYSNISNEDAKLNQAYLNMISTVAQNVDTKVLVINHTPFGRQMDYMRDFVIPTLDETNIKILCYRASHIRQLEDVMALGLDCYNHAFSLDVLPYFYHPKELEESKVDLEAKTNDVLYLTRKSSNKPNELNTYMEALCGKADLKYNSVDTSNPVALNEALNLYKDSKIAISGYFHQPGTIHEFDMVGNKLDWSALDAALNGCMFVTSDLFNKELAEIGLKAIVLPYNSATQNLKPVLDIPRLLNTLNYSDIVFHNYLNVYSLLINANKQLASNLIRLTN